MFFTVFWVSKPHFGFFGYGSGNRFLPIRDQESLGPDPGFSLAELEKARHPRLNQGGPGSNFYFNYIHYKSQDSSVGRPSCCLHPLPSHTGQI